jgi:hypothetical protein
VGYGDSLTSDDPENDGPHALLWSGSADSVVDLHPSGFFNTFAYGVSGGRQVGEGTGPVTDYWDHALVWSGSADSVIDLHQFLPVGFRDSYAQAIDDQGNILGYANDYDGYTHAILWKVVPE